MGLVEDIFKEPSPEMLEDVIKRIRGIDKSGFVYRLERFARQSR